jgi:hypothetical protein
MSQNNIKIMPLKVENLFFVFSNQEKYFLLKSNLFIDKYYKLPTCIDFYKINNTFNFLSPKNLKFCLDSYVSSFNIWLKSSNRSVKRKLILKGLGFRCFLSSDKKQISFKIGYSHIITLNVPEKILSIVIDKNFLILESCDRVLLGNFSKRIKQLKTLDVYKNKGFSYKNEILSSKPIKKS